MQDDIVSNAEEEITDKSAGESDIDEGLIDLGCPLPTDISGSSVLIAQTQDNESLVSCKELATKELNGYKWSDGLLLHSIVDETGVRQNSCAWCTQKESP